MVCILKIISAGMSIHQVSWLIIKQLFVAWAGGVRCHIGKRYAEIFKFKKEVLKNKKITKGFTN